MNQSEIGNQKLANKLVRRRLRQNNYLKKNLPNEYCCNSCDYRNFVDVASIMGEKRKIILVEKRKV